MNKLRAIFLGGLSVLLLAPLYGGCGSAVETGPASFAAEDTSDTEQQVLGRFVFSYDVENDNFTVAHAVPGNDLTRTLLTGQPLTANALALIDLSSQVSIATAPSQTYFHPSALTLSTSGITFGPRSYSKYFENVCAAIEVFYPSDAVFTAVKTLTGYNNKKGFCPGTVWADSVTIKLNNSNLEFTTPSGTNVTFGITTVGDIGTDPGSGNRFVITSWNYYAGATFRKKGTVWPPVSMVRPNSVTNKSTGIANTSELPAGFTDVSTWEFTGEFGAATGKTLTATLDGRPVGATYVSATKLRVALPANLSHGPNGYVNRELKFFIDGVAQSDTVLVNGRNEINVLFANSGIAVGCAYYGLVYAPSDMQDSGRGFWCPVDGATPFGAVGWLGDCGSTNQATHGMLPPISSGYGLWCASPDNMISSSNGTRCVTPTYMASTSLPNILDLSEATGLTANKVTDWANYPASCPDIDTASFDPIDPEE